MADKISNVEMIIMKKKKLSKEDINYIMHKTTNKLDFLTLNYIEKAIIDQNGPDFINRSKNKIEVLVSLLLNDSADDIFDFYIATFNEYMKKTHNSYEGITSFNLVFISLLHISLKIIRKSVGKKE